MLNKIVTDENFGLENKKMISPRVRIGARGIVIDDEGNIAIFNKVNKNEYKLPGGGVEKNESPESAFKREILEETGCIVDIIFKLGIIEEHKSHDNFKQISHVYVSKVIEKTNKNSLTKKEIDEGGSLLWLKPKEAYLKISKCIYDLKESKYENLYHSKFIVLRDKYILEYYMENEDK